MATNRRFAHFRRDAVPPRMNEIPEGGFCISAFLVISKTKAPKQVLAGRINKKAPWDHIGALDPERVERHSKGWMLPSSALMLGESPKEAAERIIKEQLGVVDQPLEGPFVFSEVYVESANGSKIVEVDGNSPLRHWDLEFIFQGERANTPTMEAWSELTFLDISKTQREDIARGHEDILAHVGKRIAN